MLHANSIAGALYKNKFESSEILTRMGTDSVNFSVNCRSMTEPEVFRYWRNISSDGVSRSRIAAGSLFNAHFQSFVVTKCKTNMVTAKLQ